MKNLAKAIGVFFVGIVCIVLGMIMLISVRVAAVIVIMGCIAAGCILFLKWIFDENEKL